MRRVLLLLLVACIVQMSHSEYVEEEDECTCVPLHRCRTQVNIIDIGKTTGGCKHYLDTCCTNVKPNLTVSTRMRATPGEWKVEVRPRPPLPSRIRHGCGQRNPDGTAEFRITNNLDGQTQIAEWPWMVAVVSLQEDMETNQPSNLMYHCGGSLIHTKVVLTAAHCVKSFKNQPRQLKVLLGEWDTQTENEELPVQEKKVNRIALHEEFDASTLINDVALLFLHGAARVADNVDTVCLPRLASKPVVGTLCFATGWGKDKFGQDGLYQVILKSVKLPIVSNQVCQTALKTTRLSKFFKLHDSFLCAGGQLGIDTCKGDGGGPLVCPVAGHPGHYEQVGIVSWGIGCGEAGVPGVYADVTRMRPWIDGKMRAEGFPTDTFTLSEEAPVGDSEEDTEFGTGGFEPDS